MRPGTCPTRATPPGHDARHDDAHARRPRPTPGCSSPPPRPTTPRPTCAASAARTPPSRASCGSPWVASTGSVQNAKLRLFNYNGTADGPAVYTTGNSWAESTLNWNTRPLRTSGATDDKGAITTNTWVEYNVTPFVTGNGTYSFTIAQPLDRRHRLPARENATERPELVLTIGVDSQKPTPPGNLERHRRHRAGRAHLAGLDATTWASPGYRVFRGTTQVASLGAAATSYTDTGLAPARTATRCARSTPRRTSRTRATRRAPRCRTRPSRRPPGNLTATAGTGQVALSWQASTRQRGRHRLPGVPRHHRRSRASGQRRRPTRTPASPPGPYSYTVQRDRRGAEPLRPEQHGERHRAGHDQADAARQPQATAGTGQVALTWQASTDNVGVTGYRVYPRHHRDREPGRVGDVLHRHRPRRRAPTATRCSAIDAAQNLSDPSNTATRHRARHDQADGARQPHRRPPAPARSRSRWQASTDNVGVTGYRVYRGTTQIASLGASATSYTDTGLAAGPLQLHGEGDRRRAEPLRPEQHGERHRARHDRSRRRRGNLRRHARAPARSRSRWQASTDNVGVTEYRVYRGRQPDRDGRRHRHDLHGHRPCSRARTATRSRRWTPPRTSRTRATRRPRRCPTRPSPRRRPTCERSPAAPIQVDLTWDESTDDVAVTHYKIYRDDHLIATVDPTHVLLGHGPARHVLATSCAPLTRPPTCPTRATPPPSRSRRPTSRRPPRPQNLTATRSAEDRPTWPGRPRATTSP